MEQTEIETYIRGLESAFELRGVQEIQAPRHYKVEAKWYKGRLKSLSLDDLDGLGDEEFKDVIYWAIGVLSRRHFCENVNCQDG